MSPPVTGRGSPVSFQDSKFDEIGYWSEIKLDIVREYATAYSTVLAAQQNPVFRHIYVDAFAGSGYHVSRTTGGFVEGSPVNALNVRPPFCEYHFIDLDSDKAAALRALVGDRDDVSVYDGDCNDIIPQHILPRCRWERYERALWLLDPYGLDLKWHVVETAGKLGSVEIFLNLPVMDMNRNFLWTAFWGDDSWRQAAYRLKPDLFGGHEEKADNAEIAEAYCDHLHRDAGFSHVAEPLPMRNKRGAVVYYLVFAAQRPVAQQIVSEIFGKYRDRGAPSREG
jgi:three-Cys-motif partner protein